MQVSSYTTQPGVVKADDVTVGTAAETLDASMCLQDVVVVTSKNHLPVNVTTNPSSLGLSLSSSTKSLASSPPTHEQAKHQVTTLDSSDKQQQHQDDVSRATRRLQERLAQLEQTSHGMLHLEKERLEDRLGETRRQVRDLEARLAQTESLGRLHQKAVQDQRYLYKAKVQLARKELTKAKDEMQGLLDELQESRKEQWVTQDALIRAQVSNEHYRLQATSPTSPRRRSKLVVRPSQTKQQNLLEIVEVDTDSEEDEFGFEGYQRTKHIWHQLEEEKVKARMAERDCWKMQELKEESQRQLQDLQQAHQGLLVEQVQSQFQHDKDVQSFQGHVEELTTMNQHLQEELEKVRMRLDQEESEGRKIRATYQRRLEEEEEQSKATEEKYLQTLAQLQTLQETTAKLVSQEKTLQERLKMAEKQVEDLQGETKDLREKLATAEASERYLLKKNAQICQGLEAVQQSHQELVAVAANRERTPPPCDWRSAWFGLDPNDQYQERSTESHLDQKLQSLQAKLDKVLGTLPKSPTATTS